MEEAKTAYHTPVTLGTTAHDGDDLEVVTIFDLLGFPAFRGEDQSVVFDDDQSRVVPKLMDHLIQSCG